MLNFCHQPSPSAFYVPVSYFHLSGSNLYSNPGSTSHITACMAFYMRIFLNCGNQNDIKKCRIGRYDLFKNFFVKSISNFCPPPVNDYRSMKSKSPRIVCQSHCGHAIGILYSVQQGVQGGGGQRPLNNVQTLQENCRESLAFPPPPLCTSKRSQYLSVTRLRIF